mmetsp:Transcript_53522/g.81193  ORF Transcript_53522/g.81193 Transcript_53522/m.81193 type:complete len:562 (-) Transcript_53522:199-1884(-)|eukprot:CAMPEP_0116997606 /NCGR_PEP_ID=MMETSP0472-20121206/982_1 /TAXON_ID=693140 ORGANISM="Tiarina fusus, Strain LIS" /NCGR_SAMPLE_ID=MMETSP0472 /ASSEMBLY_ACC=CAM_ASM_000603 /LENGTH=561 /DNA_ID=CAMNT_0004696535 /DNA_START=191 /DNA_END=1876 /DNA_ORIENTATION=-
MSTKKRSAEEHEVEDLKTSESAPRVRKHLKASSPTKFTPSAFNENKRSLWQQTIEKANEQFKAEISKTTDSNQTFLAACEYQRIIDEAKKLYNGPMGDVVAMGSDDGFQLGISASADDDKADDYLPTLARAIPGQTVVQVAAGGLHSAAVTNDGHVYTWGVNDDGALGREISEENMHNIRKVTEGFAPEDQGKVIGVSCGDSHSLFLTLDGKVYSTGMYKDTDSGKFKQVPPYATECKGSNSFPVPVAISKKVRAIAAGFSWNAAILEDDSLVTWGMGQSGELARSRDMGAPFKNGEYDLGKSWTGEEYEVRKMVKRVDPDTREETISEETETKYRYFQDLIVKKFLTPQPVQWSTPGKRRVLSVACGELHLVVVARMEGVFQSEVYTAGHNGFGQQAVPHGDGPMTVHELTPVQAFKGKMITKVAAGQSHSLALDIAGCAVYSWGKSDYAQLGYPVKIGAASFEWEPKQVAFPSTIGDVGIRDIGAGASVSFAITDEHDVYSWGYGDSCATGFRSDDDIVRPRKLFVLKKYKKNGGPTNCQVHQVVGGGQHTIMLIKRFG